MQYNVLEACCASAVYIKLMLPFMHLERTGTDDSEIVKTCAENSKLLQSHRA